MKNNVEKSIEMFQEEIDEIRDFSELKETTFGQILDATREYMDEYEGEISPITVVDVIEVATNIYIFGNRIADEKEIDIDEAVRQAAFVMKLSDQGYDSYSTDEYHQMINNVASTKNYKEGEKIARELNMMMDEGISSEKNIVIDNSHSK